MSKVTLPSFVRQSFSPPLPDDESFGIRIVITNEETNKGVPICVLAGSYRLPDDALLRSPSALSALVLVAVAQSEFFPVARMLNPECLAGIPADIAAYGTRQGFFALNLEDQFGLSGQFDRFSLIFSMLNWTSNVLEYKAMDT